MTVAGIAAALARGDLVALPLAFAGGLLAGLNPCCFALYPAAAACCASRERGGAAAAGRASTAVAFLAGAALAMALLGVAAVLLGRAVATALPLRLAAALLPIAAGLVLLNWIRLPALQLPRRELRQAGAFAAGFLFSLVESPCATPALAAILSYAATTGRLGYGAALALLFGLGSGLPPVLAGTAFASTLDAALAHRDTARLRRWLDPFAGCSLIGVGLYMIWTA